MTRQQKHGFLAGNFQRVIVQTVALRAMRQERPILEQDADAVYCLDAPQWVPSGSCRRKNPRDHKSPIATFTQARE